MGLLKFPRKTEVICTFACYLSLIFFVFLFFFYAIAAHISGGKLFNYERITLEFFFLLFELRVSHNQWEVVKPVTEPKSSTNGD
jgi:hypothetical protein